MRLALYSVLATIFLKGEIAAQEEQDFNVLPSLFFPKESSALEGTAENSLVLKGLTYVNAHQWVAWINHRKIMAGEDTPWGKVVAVFKTHLVLHLEQQKKDIILYPGKECKIF